MIQFCGDLLKIVSVCVGFAAIVVIVGYTMNDVPEAKDCIRRVARDMALSVIVCMVMLIVGYGLYIYLS